MTSHAIVPKSSNENYVEVIAKPIHSDPTAEFLLEKQHFMMEKVLPNMSTKIWRPWDSEVSPKEMDKRPSKTRYQPYRRYSNELQAHPLQQYLNTYKHPVRLYWTKAAYDYMYEAGESLLRNFPVQATIQIAEESDSSDSEGEDEEESPQRQERTKEDRKSV